MKKVIKLENLDCANCGMLLERTVAKIDGVTSATVNFMAQKLIVEIEDDKDGVLEAVKKSAKKVLPDVTLLGV
ncbi:MAG: cation transporter [Clostridia bacterium]|nr:cation transporter [Clostridia bacterium]MBQ4099816.1 cation transporter [Clostridia bacterium]